MRKMIFPIVTDEEQKLPCYITSIGANENQYHIQRPEGYPDFHFLYCTSGRGRLKIDGRTFDIAENMGFFFRPDIPHEYFPELEPWTTWWVTFDGFAVQELLQLAGLGRYEVFRISGMERLHQLHGYVHAAADSARPSGSYEASHMLYRFLLELKSLIGDETQKTRHGGYQRLQPLLAYIKGHYGNAV